MKGFKSDSQNSLTVEEKEVLTALWQYPALEKVFDPHRPQTVEETKKRLQTALVEFERVVRSGSKTEAEKAARVVKAMQTTLNFINELELNRTKQRR